MEIKSLNDLKKNIYEQLKPLMVKDCVLLNTPDHINIGDQLIWQGELDFLTSLDIQPSYMTSHFNFDWREFSKGTLILLHGGGNFGDVWEGHQDFRLKIIEKYPNNDILIFPQSVEYIDLNIINADAKRFAGHKNVTICARDQFSYDLLKNNFSNNILLVPDMAFCMKLDGFNNVKKNRKLLLKRKDREVPSDFNYSNYHKFEQKDWPSFDNSVFNFTHRVWEKVNRMFASNFLSKITTDTTFGMGVLRDKDWLIKKGIDFITSYDLVVSTRLHGHILALLLDVPTIMIDNSYGKNKRFYDTWLKNIPESRLVSTDKELDKILKEH